MNFLLVLGMAQVLRMHLLLLFQNITEQVFYAISPRQLPKVLNFNSYFTHFFNEILAKQKLISSILTTIEFIIQQTKTANALRSGSLKNMFEAI